MRLIDIYVILYNSYFIYKDKRGVHVAGLHQFYIKYKEENWNRPFPL